MIVLTYKINKLKTTQNLWKDNRIMAWFNIYNKKQLLAIKTPFPTFKPTTVTKVNCIEIQLKMYQMSLLYKM